MKRLLIMGAPGSGKGTQAAVISRVFGVPAISTGDIFREQVRLETPLGLEVKTTMAAGDYVSDELTTDLVVNRLRQSDASEGFILDGYPRTAAQVVDLDRILEIKRTPLDTVVHLTADVGELTARLLRRGREQGRSDDTAASVHHRIDLYERQSVRLREIYRQRGILIEVDGARPLADVSDTLLLKLESLKKQGLR